MIFTLQLFVKIDVICPQPLIGRLSPTLASDWPGMTGSCFLISNLDCSEQGAVLHTIADMRVRISENIIYGEQTSSSSGAVGENCFLLDHSGAEVTNGNGERLNFPALSGSRQVAGSKLNSLPFWTRLMFLLWRCRVSPEIAIKSFSEHKYTRHTQGDPTSISQLAPDPALPGAGGETSESLHRLTSELLRWEEDPADV